MLASVGLLVLVVGASVYLLDRPAGAVPFFGAVSLAELTPSVFGWLGGHLPSFAHVFAFGVLTAAVLAGTRRAAAAASIGWCLVDTAFELGQHPAVGPRLSAGIGSVVDNLPVLVYLDRYFVNGTYDPGDLAFIVIGAVAAYCVVRWSHGSDGGHA